MGARAIGSGTICFGWVRIPVKVYPTIDESKSLSFNMLHNDCNKRVKQKLVCPACADAEVAHADTKKGYEFAKDQYVALSGEEHKALLELGGKHIELAEFVPENEVDPVLFDKVYYLGPEKGADRPYRVVGQALEQARLVGVATYASHGKRRVVVIRPRGAHLLMQQLHFADEVRPIDEVSVDGAGGTKNEVALAVKIVKKSAKKKFDPTRYRDEVKDRMLELIQRKIDAGEEIVAAADPDMEVVDLEVALLQSLGPRAGTKSKPRKPTMKRAAG